MKANAPDKVYIDADEDWHRTYINRNYNTSRFY